MIAAAAFFAFSGLLQISLGQRRHRSSGLIRWLPAWALKLGGGALLALSAAILISANPQLGGLHWCGIMAIGGVGVVLLQSFANDTVKLVCLGAGIGSGLVLTAMMVFVSL
ncbi:MAG: hypothetical protein BGP08_15390 [Rhizobiales bacterium 64-17]|nr:MAG: hypothetical protein BGP08_15390 [Rhizobiales bacterium 64-17]